MNKGELIASVAEKAGVPKSTADAVVNAVFGAITDALKDGDKVALVGFGNFEVKDRAAREGRNPAPGETITIEASKSVAFKASKALKESL